jgi:hypothetical protein
MQDYFFNGVWRMDWGMGNPNKTAALIACLMVASWAIPYLIRRGFWTALALFTALGLCLAQTMSRGGILSFAAGIIPVLLYAPRPWPKPRVIGLITSIAIIAAAVVTFGTAERLAQSATGTDRSVTNRLALWSAAVTMIADAPDGWGTGQSGHAYREWYQPLERVETYRTLVSTHLTTLVESAWPTRALYAAAWTAAIALCIPTARTRSPRPGDLCMQIFPVCLGIWIAFFVSGIFSTVAEHPALWIVPGLTLGTACMIRLATRTPPPRWTWPLPAIAALATLAPLAWKGSPIHRSADTVRLGDEPIDALVIADPTVLGDSPGRALRAWRDQGGTGTIAIARSVDNVPTPRPHRILLTGKFTSNPESLDWHDLAATHRLLIVNPTLFPTFRPGHGHPARVQINSEQTTLLTGSFANSPTHQAWSAILPSTRLEGVAEFIPNWPEALLPLLLEDHAKTGPESTVPRPTSAPDEHPALPETR